MFYYKTVTGIYIESSEVERSFRISTGFDIDGNMAKFMKYLNSIWGKYIIEACNPTIEDLIKSDQRVLAIKKYRKDNNCSLMDARNYIYNTYFPNEIV